MSKPQSSRITPPGELLTEMVVSPSENLFVEAVIAPVNKRANPLSFQSFGIHSTSAATILSKEKSANGFHSFNSQIAEETKAEVIKPASSFHQGLVKSLDESNEEDQKQKFGNSLLIVCLLVALLFFTGLAFAATYFFEEKSVAPQIRETSLLSNESIRAQRAAAAFSDYSFSTALVRLDLSYFDHKKVCR